MTRLAPILTLSLFLPIFAESAYPDVIISELMARNSNGLKDSDGNQPDWIEIYNPGPGSVSLDGYTLTNDPVEPAKWTFPAVTLPENGFLVVFASEKDRREDVSELHTNFTIDSEGAFVALSNAQGKLTSQFDLAGVDQFDDVSYGVAQSGARQESVLLRSRVPARVRVPTSEIQNWTGFKFNDTSWQSATTGIGYERGNGYDSLIGPNGDVESQMFNRNGSVYFRVPFQAADVTGLVSLTLKMKYDDGFAAFLNGVRVANANAPATLRWNSTSTGNPGDGAAAVFSDFDLTSFARELRPGTNVLAIQGLNTGLTSSDLIFMPEIHAARLTDATIGDPGYLSEATPGAFNSESFDGFVKDTKFSVDRGFFTEPFLLTITTGSEDASIRITTDGSDPTANTGTLYAGPLTISKTTVLRAAAFRDGFVSSNVDTHTYLFLEDVIRQSSNRETPPGWPSDGAVNGHNMKYGMSPVVVSREGAATVIEALRAVPTFSLVTPLPNLFDRSRGIYVNPGNDGRNWERPASLELIKPDGSKGFQVGAGVRIRGGFSRSNGNPKHAFRMFFRREYGDAKLRYPLFGDEGVDEFDNIDLRTTQNYSWAFQRDARNTFLRDVFSRDLQGKMGHPYTRSRYYHLYVNGIYWGLTQTQERAEASFAESYFGGNKEDYDVISKFGSTTDGNRDAYTELWQEATSGFRNNDARYFRVQGLNTDGTRNPEFKRLLDVQNVIDYMILTYYTGDRDGPGSRFSQPNPNNFFAILDRENPDGFKYFEHDSEHSLDTGENNMVSPFTRGSSASQFNPHWLHEKLMSNTIYHQRFINRVQEVLFNGGFLTPENATAIIDHRAAQIDQAIIGESARWGWFANRTNPFSRAIWLNAVDSTRSWISRRIPVLLSQLRAVNWFPGVDAPEFPIPGGPVASGFKLKFDQGAATIYYTLNGTDPQLPDGSVNPDAAIAEVASGATSFRLLGENDQARAFVPTSEAFGTDWREKGNNFDDSTWKKGAAGIGFDQNDTYDPFIKIDVIEDMFGKNGSVYIRIPFEIKDASTISILTLQMRYDDGFVAYLNGVEVASANAPGNRSWNSSANSQNDDGAAQVFQAFDISQHVGLLDARGENLLAIHGLNADITSSDMLISPRLEAGTLAGGTSIVLPDGVVPVKARIRDGKEWSALSVATFQVGVKPPAPSSLVISEIMYHPSDPTPEEIEAGFINDGAFEFIEVRNRSGEGVDLSGVSFINGIEFTFEDGVILEPGTAVVLARNEAAFALRYGLGIQLSGVYEGSLDNAGERIVLADPNGNVIADFKYNDRGEWPGLPDGGGRSLTLRSVASESDDAASWRPSTLVNGSPGFDDSLSYATWLTIHFSEQERANPAQVAMDADPDSDGLENLGEYATGANPRTPDAGGLVQISVEPLDDGLRVRLSLRTSLAADEVVASPQVSREFSNWFDLGSEAERDGEQESTLDAPEIVDRIWRIDTVLAEGDPAVYFRFWFER
jgi:hypothetical protein